MTEVSWRELRCTQCGAPAGQLCFSASGKPAGEPHAARRQAAREASMPRPLLGYAPTYETPHVVSLTDRGKAICGSAIDTIPEIQPPLTSADPRCRNLLGKVAYARNPVLTGVCPVCVSDEDLDDKGRIVAHKQVLGIARTDVDCDGAGQLPDGES